MKKLRQHSGSTITESYGVISTIISYVIIGGFLFSVVMCLGFLDLIYDMKRG